MRATMPDDTPPPPPPHQPYGEQPRPGHGPWPGPGINISEEFGTAKRNLPPRGCCPGLGCHCIVVGVLAFVQRAKPPGGGSVDSIAAVEIPKPELSPGGGECHVHIQAKALWIHDIKATIKTTAANSATVLHPRWTSIAISRPFPH